MVAGDCPDNELIVASLEEPGLFAEIFERHYAAVFGFVGAAVGKDAAADIASEVFLRGFAVRHRYNVNYRSARPWLFGISSNLVADYYRIQARRARAYQRSAGRDFAIADFEDDAASRLDAAAASPALAKALASLRIDQVSIVALFVLDDMSYSEIAQTLGIPEGTVRSRLSRARALLRNLMANWDEQEVNGWDE